MAECPNLRMGRGSGWGKPFSSIVRELSGILARGQRWKQDGDPAATANSARSNRWTGEFVRQMDELAAPLLRSLFRRSASELRFFEIASVACVPR